MKAIRVVVALDGAPLEKRRITTIIIVGIY
jgi:hypothetical protein